jgi:predicted MPP superfamily phosphohydrolase
MRALILSHLHLSPNILFEEFRTSKYKRILKLNNISPEKYDIVLISGDVVESNILKYETEDPLVALYNLFEKPVIFCLGNHEFAYQRYIDVIKYWSKFKHPYVHCLDVEGHAQIENCNFVGNVFWYDWSLNECRQLMSGEILDGWLDASIEEFDPIHENIKCQKQIVDNL